MKKTRKPASSIHIMLIALASSAVSGPSWAKAMLLKAMQENSFTRPGTNEKCPLDTRLIISTRLDPEALVAKGELRKDLYYFIKGSMLILPTPQERKSDNPLRAHPFVRATDGRLAQLARERKPEVLHAH